MMPKAYYRQDGFTPARRAGFLKALAKAGCVADACRGVGLSTTSAYRVRARDPEFAADWARAQAMAGAHLEGVLYARAVEGTETQIVRGGVLVEVRRRPSDALLRLMLQAANPRKYGRVSRGGETRSQIEKRVRAQIEAEWRANRRIPASADELRALIWDKLEVKREELSRQGWSTDANGEAVSPSGQIYCRASVKPFPGQKPGGPGGGPDRSPEPAPGPRTYGFEPWPNPYRKDETAKADGEA